MNATPAPARDEPLLVAENVSRSFGALQALDGLWFEIRSDEMFGIAGPNGAGKSTLLNVCTGVLAPSSGKLLFAGKRIDGAPAHRFCHRGIARSFQIPKVFDSLTVGENVTTGAMFGLVGKPVEGRTSRQFIDAILVECGLKDKCDAPVKTVDLLTRKMTMLAAALATKPKLVFMDEPLGGFTSIEIDRMVGIILHLRKIFGITFVIVEHKVRALTQLSDRIMIMHNGRCIRLDAPSVVMSDPEVIEIYLGSETIA